MEGRCRLLPWQQLAVPHAMPLPYHLHTPWPHTPSSPVQHCIKLELEKALEDVKDMMSQLAPASMLNDMVSA